MTMIARDDQAGVDSELATDAGGQAMKLTFHKWDDTTTYYTLEAGADEARAHMRAYGTKEPDFFSGCFNKSSTPVRRASIPTKRVSNLCWPLLEVGGRAMNLKRRC
jgi:hypothetical protein